MIEVAKFIANKLKYFVRFGRSNKENHHNHNHKKFTALNTAHDDGKRKK